MTKKLLPIALAAMTLMPCAWAQVIYGTVMKGDMPTIAVPDFRGAGDSAPYMNAFNQTLFSDIQDSGLFKMAGKSLYPLVTPQQPSDFQPPAPGAPAARRA